MRAPLPESFDPEILKRTPVEPRLAATVVVTRDGEHGLETYLMRRQATMAFGAGQFVFPGGGMEDSDADLDVPWVGPPPAVWAQRFGCNERTAKGLVTAAVRETFEETGVLLAGPDEHTVVGDTSGDDFAGTRDALEKSEISFADFLRARGLVMRADLLGAWAHWITPSTAPRRFDTHFFVALLPEGQTVGTMSGEADKAGWLTLTEAIAAVDAGEMSMMPPTLHTCREIVQHAPSELLAAAAQRTIRTVEPRVVEHEGRYYLQSDIEDEDEA